MLLASKILAVAGFFLFVAAIVLEFLGEELEVGWPHAVAVNCAILSPFMFLAMLIVLYWQQG